MLRLSSSDWFGARILAPIFAEFAKMQPHVVVELITGIGHRSLARREADIVFKNRPFEEPEAVSRRLMHIPYAVYIPAGFDRPRAGDGAGTPLITMDTAFEGMADAVWLKRMLPRAHIVSRSNNRDVQGRICALGVGAAVLPQTARGLRFPDVERVDHLGEEPPGRDTWVGYHRDMRRLARLRALLGLC